MKDGVRHLQRRAEGALRLHPRRAHDAHSVAREPILAPRLVPQREPQARWSALPLGPGSAARGGRYRRTRRRRDAAHAPLLLDSERQSIMLGEMEAHFKRAALAREPRAKLPQRPERAQVRDARPSV